MGMATAKVCDTCGKAHDVNQDGKCAHCEHVHLECDGYAKETLLHVLEATVERALDYLAPGDVFECVHEALRHTGCDGADPVAKTVALAHQARRKAERSEREAVAA